MYTSVEIYIYISTNTHFSLYHYHSLSFYIYVLEYCALNPRCSISCFPTSPLEASPKLFRNR